MENKKIAIIMDALETVNIEKDTTFALALEAQSQKSRLWFVSIDDLMVRETTPYCFAREIQFQRKYPCYQWLNLQETINLDEFDIILIRKDPPFDEKYFFATHILEQCKKAKVVNNPTALRNAPEKIYSLNFPETIPPTIITSVANEIHNFMNQNGGEIILKPLNKCGGSGIIYMHQQDKNFYSMVDVLTQEGNEYIMAQRYLPEIRQGDKRVICVNGKAYGAILRIPNEMDHRGNIHVGGQVVISELTSRDKWLVDQISENLQKDGLFFVGLDIIGDYITEINVTSPTGIQEILEFGGADIAKIFWDELK